MAEHVVERGYRKVPRIVALAVAALAIPACSKAGESVDAKPAIKEEARVEIVSQHFPDTIWGPAWVDTTENATVDCTLADSYSSDIESIDYQFFASRPWFISSEGEVGDQYQSGGYAGNGTLIDPITEEVQDGWYIHRGENDTFAVYATDSEERAVDETGRDKVKFSLIDTIDLHEVSLYDTRVYENESAVLALVATDSLPHFLDGSVDALLLYPPIYPQKISGTGTGPGLAVDVSCKQLGSTLPSSSIPMTAAGDII